MSAAQSAEARYINTIDIVPYSVPRVKSSGHLTGNTHRLGVTTELQYT